MKFVDLGLGPKVEAAVEAAGYETPTPIQAKAIPVALQGRDVLGIAQTGTGKTASFTLPMISLLERGRARARMPRSLILAPTRELAAQVAESFEKYGINQKLDVALLIGGVSFDEQFRKLDRGVDVLIATPGRLIDHFQRGKLLLTGVQLLVIDEADRMLDMGFVPDIEKICKLLPPKRQTLFFSATMPPEIQRLVDTFLNDPVQIEVAPPASTALTIRQRFWYCADGEDGAKREQLRKFLREDNVKNAIVFCNRKRDVAILLKSLQKHGFDAGALHGDMDQASRMETLAAFRSGEVAILAASDVAARGLDIPEVSHVFNFDIPWAAEDYVHRIGRTGRAGREGHSTSLVGFEELKLIADIEKLIGQAPEWIGEPPSEDDITDSKRKKKRRRSAAKATAKSDSSTSSSSEGSDRGRARRGGRRKASTHSDGTRDNDDAVVQADAQNVAPKADEQTDDRPSTRGGSDGARARRQRRTKPVEADPQTRSQPADRQAPDKPRAKDKHEAKGKPEAKGKTKTKGTPAGSDPLEVSKKPEVSDKRTASDKGDAEHPVHEPVQIEAGAEADQGQSTARARGRKKDEKASNAEAAFGGHVPAFLQRPVRPQPRSSETAKSDA